MLWIVRNVLNPIVYTAAGILYRNPTASQCHRKSHFDQHPLRIKGGEAKFAHHAIEFRRWHERELGGAANMSALR
jgi:hypothetical protein